MDCTEDALRAFVTTRFRASLGSKTLDTHTPLFSSGIIDSFGVLELIAFLDETFGVDIDPARHEIDEFDTLGKIQTLVNDLKQRGGASR